jgi:hypothetical protein
MITDLCNELLGRTVEEIKELDENPADYLYSYFRQSVYIASTFSSRDTLRLDLDWYGTVNPPDCRNNQKTRRDLIFSRDNLSRFVGNEQLRRGRPPKVQTLLADYDALIQEAQVIGLDMQGLLQQTANSAVMEETKRGIAQADAVRR